MRNSERRFSGSNITIMVVAVCATAVLAPLSVAAANGAPATSRQATAVVKPTAVAAGRVVTQAVSPRDPITGSWARIIGGAQQVGGTVKTVASGGTQKVQGTVTVGNLPATQPVSGTVNVGNLPATQPVSGTVGISGSVQTAPQAPFDLATSGFIAYNSDTGSATTTAPTSASYSVIQTISGSLYIPAGYSPNVAINWTAPDGSTHSTNLPQSYTSTFSSTAWYAISVPVNLYVKSGSTITFGVGISGVANVGSQMDFDISGYSV